MEEFIKAGFTVIGTEPNPIPQFNNLRELQDFIRANNLDNEETLENHSLDIGFKVFDSVEAPQLKVDDKGKIQFPELNNDPLF
jgi:hypothetical protein